MCISVLCGHATIAQYLLDQKAGVHYRVYPYYKNLDALRPGMSGHATRRAPGVVLLVALRASFSVVKSSCAMISRTQLQ
jgi:hypothetical protein